MNFAPHHYVPILKIKRGEKSALSRLSPAVQSQMTPLLELVELPTGGSAPISTMRFKTSLSPSGHLGAASLMRVR